jgi:hypothetical protein
MEEHVGGLPWRDEHHICVEWLDVGGIDIDNSECWLGMEKKSSSLSAALISRSRYHLPGWTFSLNVSANVHCEQHEKKRKIFCMGGASGYFSCFNGRASPLTLHTGTE